jgi:hypothetical protein
MKEQMARQIAAEFAACWHGRIQVQIIALHNRHDGEDGSCLLLKIPRENRMLRLTREEQLNGVLDICTLLLGSPQETTKTREEIMQHIEIAAEEPQSDSIPGTPAQTLLSEEEAAAYLGVKQATIRVYVTAETLRVTGEGTFALEDLRSYKERRDARWSKPRKLVADAPADAKAVADAPADRSAETPGEAQLLQTLIAHVFTETPGITGLGRLAEAPRSWKVDVTTERGPESYRVTRQVDGSFQQERW